MKSQPTIAETFELAIELERVQQRFYNQLAGKFSHLSHINEFWQSLANDEVIHEDALTRIQKALDEKRLNDPVDPLLYERTKKRPQPVSSRRRAPPRYHRRVLSGEVDRRVSG